MKTSSLRTRPSCQNKDNKVSAKYKKYPSETGVVQSQEALGSVLNADGDLERPAQKDSVIAEQAGPSNSIAPATMLGLLRNWGLEHMHTALIGKRYHSR